MPLPALLVIDMQNGFCAPDGYMARSGRPLAGVDDAVANAAVAISTARAANLPVVFVRHTYQPGHADIGPNLRSRPSSAATMGGLINGGWDAEIVPQLGWTTDDLTVVKTRFDAFLWSTLAPLLQSLGVSHLYALGVVTNICVESTVRTAFMRDYDVSVVADACAGATAQQHEASLQEMAEVGFADLVDAGQLPARFTTGVR